MENQIPVATDRNVFTMLNYTTRREETVGLIPVNFALFLIALNILFAIFTFLGNLLILTSLPRVYSVHPPTKLLFRCLAIADLCVAPISLPTHITSLFRGISNVNLIILKYATNINYLLSIMLCEVSIFTSTAISLDRFLALHLGLRYRIFVTLKRVRFVVILFWLTGISNGIMFIVSGSAIALSVAVVLTVLSVFVSTFSYTKIFLMLRQRHVQIQDQGDTARIMVNIAKYKETVSSIKVVQLALIACYLPAIVVVSFQALEKATQIAWELTISLLFFNSALNPILYTWRIKALRQAVKDTIRRILCPSSS